MSWRILSRKPFDCNDVDSKPIALGDSKFLIVSGTNRFCEYDIQRNKWRTYTIKSPLLQLPIIGGTYDPIRDFLFLTLENAQTICMEKKTFKVEAYVSWTQPWTGPRPHVVCSSDSLHIIVTGMALGSTSQILCHIACTFFDESSCSTTTKLGSSEELQDAVFCQSRDSIIIKLSGGRFGEYKLSTKKWDFWKWKQWPSRGCDVVASALVSRGMVCTAYSGHLILFREPKGTNCGANHEMIVCDLEDHESRPKLSTLRCPPKSVFGRNVVLMKDRKSDELSTFGFIRKCFEEEKMEDLQLFPRYIIQMIAKWVEMEWMHSLPYGKGHWKVRVDDILKSVI